MVVWSKFYAEVFVFGRFIPRDFCIGDNIISFVILILCFCVLDTAGLSTASYISRKCNCSINFNTHRCGGS